MKRASHQHQQRRVYYLAYSFSPRGSLDDSNCQCAGPQCKPNSTLKQLGQPPQPELAEDRFFARLATHVVVLADVAHRRARRSSMLQRRVIAARFTVSGQTLPVGHHSPTSFIVRAWRGTPKDTATGTVRPGKTDEDESTEQTTTTSASPCSNTDAAPATQRTGYKNKHRYR
jgi:hypothetical protein